MTWGNKLSLSIFGESHGSGVGIVIDGFPSGLLLDLNFIKNEMKRRSPGNNPFGTPRHEDDEFEILSGYFNNCTTGAPLCIFIRNKNTISSDYDELAYKMRPSHSDYGAFIKFNGFNDYRGGGSFSARVTAGLVFAGAICKQILNSKNIFVGSHILSVGNIHDSSFNDSNLNCNVFNDLSSSNLPLLEKSNFKKIENLINDLKSDEDSIGGILECAIINVPAGIGRPFFDSIESSISSLAFSLPGVKGIEFGDGFDISYKKGSIANDSMYYEHGIVKTHSNNNGGIVGGLTNGSPIIFKTAFKPTSSIGTIQNTINVKDKSNVKLKITGRHDPCIAIRAIPLIESIGAIAIVNELL